MSMQVLVGTNSTHRCKVPVENRHHTSRRPLELLAKGWDHWVTWQKVKKRFDCVTPAGPTNKGWDKPCPKTKKYLPVDSPPMRLHARLNL